MKKKQVLMVLGGLILLTDFCCAQSADDALFGAPGDADQPVPQASTTQDIAGKLLGAEQKTSLMGAFQYTGVSTWTQSDPDLNQAILLDLGLIARPDQNLRVETKGRWSYDPGMVTASFHVSEAFVDFQGGDSLYFRAGKQFIQWGRGYFYSPADVLNLTTIDPTDPTNSNNPKAVKEGPTSFKATLEKGNAGLYQTVVSTDQVTTGSNVSFASQGTWSFFGSEVSLGGFWQPSRIKSPRTFVTSGFKAFGTNFYTESILLWGNDQQRVSDDGNGGLTVDKNDGRLLTQQTIGASYSMDETERLWSFSSSLQYYYNGTGASDPSVYHDRATALSKLLNNGTLSSRNATGYGTHYLAGSLEFLRILRIPMTAGTSFTASLTEVSWSVTPRTTYQFGPDLTLGAQTTWNRGAVNSEYSRSGDTSQWQLDALVFSKLTIKGSGPLPGSQAWVHPALEVDLSGFEF